MHSRSRATQHAAKLSNHLAARTLSSTLQLQPSVAHLNIATSRPHTIYPRPHFWVPTQGRHSCELIQRSQTA